MVKIVDRSWREKSLPMLKFLKVMYYAGFLPVNWTSNEDGDHVRFEICWLKTILLIFFDFLMAMIIPAYVFIWHWLNVPWFDYGQLLTKKYYLDFNDGVVTTTICELVYVTYPFFLFWIYGTIGHGMANLSKLLQRPWFHLKYRLMSIMNFAVLSAIIIHVIYYSDKMARVFNIEKNWKFYVPTIVLLGLGLIRLILFKTFYDVMLTSLLRGWVANKPCIDPGQRMMVCDWKHLKSEVDTFSFYLLFTVSSNVVSSILTCYIILTLPMTMKPFEEHYKEYIALITLLVASNINFYTIVRHCEKAYEAISQLQDEILYMEAEVDHDEAAIQWIHLRQDALDILTRAKPLTGRGFFMLDKPMIISIISAATTYIIVLLQFNMAEIEVASKTNLSLADTTNTSYL